jgi:hypothetical protein
MLLPLHDPNVHAASCFAGVYVGASVMSAVGLSVYVLEHLQPGRTLNHVVVFKGDILYKGGLLDGVSISSLCRLCGVLNQFRIC